MTQTRIWELAVLLLQPLAEGPQGKLGQRRADHFSKGRKAEDPPQETVLPPKSWPHFQIWPHLTILTLVPYMKLSHKSILMFGWKN